MKYIDAEKLKAEIERLYDGEAPKHDQQCDFDDGYYTGIGAISKFIDSLQQEPQEEICSKCIHHKKNDDCYYPYGGMQSWINENGVYECTGFCEKEQEQPEVDLEKELDNYMDGYFSECQDGTLLNEGGSELQYEDVYKIARHFYELGLKARKDV